MQVEHGVTIARHLLRVGFSMKHPKRASIALRCFELELPRSECEQVRGNRLRLRVTNPSAFAGGLAGQLGAVGHGGPSGRDRQFQFVARLEIRLVEAREGQVRSRGHKQGVQELAVAVQRLVAGDELDDNLVFTTPGCFGRNRQMTVGKRERRVRGADAHASYVVARLREVEYDPVWRAQSKSHDGPALNRFVDIAGDGKEQVVPQRADRRRSLLGESVRNAASGKVSARLARKHGRQ